MRLRIWCETMSHAALLASPALALVARAGVQIVLAVRPWDVAGLGDVAAACEGAGAELALWPMLDDAAGRWVSAGNAEAFVDLARRAIERARVREIVFDVEPPIDRVRTALTGPRGLARAAIESWSERGKHAARAERAFGELSRVLAARGVEAWATVLPFAGLPRYLPPVTRVHAMLYTSMLEGYSRGLVGRRRARLLLAAGARVARARFGDRAGVSLGAAGTGALGDEPTYRSPAELAEDVAVARAAGIRDLALFDLGGVVARPPVEAWLRALASGSGIGGGS